MTGRNAEIERDLWLLELRKDALDEKHMADCDAWARERKEIKASMDALERRRKIGLVSEQK